MPQNTAITFAGLGQNSRWAPKVTISVVDSEACDPPTKRYRSDKEVQESPFTDEEMLEMRRQDYLRLKAALSRRGDG